MGDEIAYLKSELRAILADISRSHPGLDIRLGLVAYRDLGDVYVTRTLPFTANARLDAGQPRAPNMPTAAAIIPRRWTSPWPAPSAQDWRPDAVKSLLLVADAPPHDENIGKTWRAAEAARAQANPDRAGRRLGRRRRRRICDAGDGRGDPVALHLPHRRQRHRQSARRARRSTATSSPGSTGSSGGCSTARFPAAGSSRGKAR